MERQVFSVSEFVALTNQTLEYAYSHIVIEGEISEYRVSKGKWIYFKLQDAHSSVQFFATVYQIQFPVEDGMLVKVTGTPKLHNKYGFSVTAHSIVPSGEGGIKKALELLKKKLEQEGLFEEVRKRELPKIPRRIGLVTSAQAAAYHDFIKILTQRWQDIEVVHVDVQVQGEVAPQQIAAAIETLNIQKEPIDVIVITRGGGSAEDLIAFSSEVVVRAVAASRVPTIVGVGHEVDTSLADLAADVRATTPTNAAQLVVPNKAEVLFMIESQQRTLINYMQALLGTTRSAISHAVSGLVGGVRRPKQHIIERQNRLNHAIEGVLATSRSSLLQFNRTLQAYDPKRMLARGYGLVLSKDGRVLTDAQTVNLGDKVMIELHKGKLETEVIHVDK